MMKRKIITLTSLILLIMTASSQAQERSGGISVYAGGGLQSLAFTLDNGTTSKGFGFTAGATYQYVINANWGIVAGLDLSSFTSRTKMSMTESTQEFDSENNLNYELRTYYLNFEGKQNALMLGIPIGVSYNKPLKSNLNFVAAMGLKIQIPVSSKYKTTDGTIETRGYYDDYKVELSDLPNHNFTSYNPAFDGKITMKIGSALFADAGISANMSCGRTLYAGLYGSYGFTNMNKESSDPLVTKGPVYNGLLNSSHVGAVHTFAVGVKLGVSIFKFNKRKAAEEPAPAPVAPEPVPEVEPAPEVEPVQEVEPAPVAEPAPVVEPEPAPVPTVDSTEYTYGKTVKCAKTISSSMSFDLDSFEAKQDDSIIAELDSLATLLKANPNFVLDIYGYTCDLGSESTNRQVGQGRADYVKDLLVDRGVPESQITTKSKGASEPLVPNTTDANREKNRRVNLVVGR